MFVKTYGCQMNARDSEMVAVLLQRQGYELTHHEEEADVVLVNTCSVRAKAEEKALGKLGLLVASKRARPARLVGVMGCMVQRLGSQVLARARGVDFAVGTQRLTALPALVEAVRRTGRPMVDVAETPWEADPATHAPGNVSAFINILRGCDRRCAYCAVPLTRGREWSRPAAAVLEEARLLARDGVRELTLLGQSVMAYGLRGEPVWPAGSRSPRGFTEPLPRLLEALQDVAGVCRVRFTSGHPSGCTEELARAMAELPTVCAHLHLPLQSGSDRVLARMRRGYAASDYRAAATRLRTAAPELALTTDVMVGFPAETEDDFERTRAFMEEMDFDHAFVFQYNPRPGTPSAEWPDDVSAEDKLRRNHALLDDQAQRSARRHRAWVGRTAEVLAEGPSKRNTARWAGRTRTNNTVVFEAPPGARPGDLLAVRIERAGAQTLHGSVQEGLSV